MDSTKDHILGSVRASLPAQKADYPVCPRFPYSLRPLKEEFVESLELGAGTCHAAADEAEAHGLLARLFPDAKVICSAVPEIAGNRDLDRIADPHELVDVDVGIVRARFGVAETGMVWLTGRELKVNALGFLSQHLVILLREDRIVRDMYEAYRLVDLTDDPYGCFMLGPSATADIGAVMVRGAQGARSLTVFFM